MNKKEYTELRDSINKVISKLNDTETTIKYGKDKVLSVRNGIVKFTGILGDNKKTFPNYYSEIDQPGYLTREDLHDLKRTLRHK